MLTDNGTNGTVTGLSPASINYTDADISSLTIDGGSGGNTFTIDGTLVNAGFAPTPDDAQHGLGNDTTNVLATNAGSLLTIHGQAGTDAVNVGSAGSVADISGPDHDRQHHRTDRT